ncbi:Glucanosyltransferase-domain-containing protein [Mycena galericulata]|nr:Glucanosyltransferase-domain-containing protein [Mycena galericulata]
MDPDDAMNAPHAPHEDVEDLEDVASELDATGSASMTRSPTPFRMWSSNVPASTVASSPAGVPASDEDGDDEEMKGVAEDGEEVKQEGESVFEAHLDADTDADAKIHEAVDDVEVASPAAQNDADAASNPDPGNMDVDDDGDDEEDPITPAEQAVWDARYRRLEHLLERSAMYSGILAEQMEGAHVRARRGQREARVARKAERVAKKAERAERRKQMEAEEEGRPRKRRRRGAKAVVYSDVEEEEEEEEAEEDAEDNDNDTSAFPQPALVTSARLKDYQLEGLQWMVSLDQQGISGILADEMGLGKTLQTIAFTAYLRARNFSRPIMIVCPLSVLHNWKEEYERFAPGIPVTIYHGAPAHRAELRRTVMSIPAGWDPKAEAKAEAEAEAEAGAAADSASASMAFGDASASNTGTKAGGRGRGRGRVRGRGRGRGKATKSNVPSLDAAALLGLVTSAGAIQKVTRTGRDLYTADGNCFYIKGIACQTQGFTRVLTQAPTLLVVENLADAAGCTRDLPNLQKLGANAIRAYSVDSTLNHDSSMNVLSEAGIYIILDFTSTDTTQPVWDTNLFDQYIKTIDVFNKYDNVLAYNVGNEVLTANATNAAPFLEAAARDVKAYLASISSSALVGYADIDGASTFRDAVADYLSCDPPGSNSGSTAIDIFGLNNYEWCGNASTTTYNALNTEFENYNVVAYFSEFGSETCDPGMRVWTEVATLFASPMTNVWSGRLAFSYFAAESQGQNFGMVTLSSDNITATTNADFANLVAQYSAVSIVNSPAQSAAPAATYGACPSEGASLEAAATLPATPNESECDCVASALSCQFKAPSGGADDTVLLGTLTGVVANGTSGVYGRVTGCDPVRLSFPPALLPPPFDSFPSGANANEHGGIPTIRISTESDREKDKAAAGSSVGLGGGRILRANQVTGSILSLVNKLKSGIRFQVVNTNRI